MAQAHDHISGSYGETHAGPTFSNYLVIFGALSVFTAISFVVNAFTRERPHIGAAIILGVAVVKALLVAMYFMHLKFDWSRLYFLIFPVVILTIMMMVILLPDIVVGWHVNPESAISNPGLQQPPIPSR
jgi:caa(3)-type oxidase subunit IV